MFFISCEEKTGDLTIDLGYEYFPLDVGKYITYQVDSTLFDNEGMIVINTSSFVKEEITESFVDETGDTTYRIERFYKENLEDQWLITDVWTASRTTTQAFRTEENLRFIKIVFPPREGTSWNGNSFIDPSIEVEVAGDPIQMFKNWDYSILSTDQAEFIGSRELEAVTTVQMADDENVIERRFAQEKYAKGIGLVFRRFEILDTQCIEACVGLTWEEKAWQGFTMTQILLDHN